MLRIVSLAVALGACAAIPGQRDDPLRLVGGDPQPLPARAVDNPATPNQILDAVLEGAVQNMQTLGWCESKNVQNGESILPLQVDIIGHSSENLVITHANATGLCSLRRSKSASFNTNQGVLTGSVVMEDVRVNAAFSVQFDGVGEAPAQTEAGQVVEQVEKLFADIQINLENLVPQSIASYKVRLGRDELEKVTNLEDSAMKDVHVAGFRKALREVLKKIMATNVKVQINKSIQSMKSA